MYNVRIPVVCLLNSPQGFSGSVRVTGNECKKAVLADSGRIRYLAQVQASGVEYQASSPQPGCGPIAQSQSKVEGTFQIQTIDELFLVVLVDSSWRFLVDLDTFLMHQGH